MWRLEKTFTFEASHLLPLHDGKCRRLHGHSFRGKVVCEDSKLHASGPKSGMLMDFGDLSAVLKPFVDEFLDHWHLNESTGLENPTSEELARWIYDRLKVQIPTLVLVRVEETCTSSAEYWEGDHAEPATS